MDDHSTRDTTIEEQLLRRHDPHIHEFAQDIGACVECPVVARSTSSAILLAAAARERCSAPYPYPQARIPLMPPTEPPSHETNVGQLP